MTTKRICLIEDDEIMGDALALRLELDGYECAWHRSGRSALAALKRDTYDAVVSDIKLPDASGDEIFNDLLASGQRLPPFVFMTGYGTVDQAVRLIKQGAADYLTKPFAPELLLAKLRELTSQIDASVNDTPLGISPAMRAIEELLGRLAKSDASVLVTGESGVGKEVFARRLHALRDADRGRHFVAVNCGAFPEGLMEAELFGYEKGAYTGATRAKRGLLEEAEGGTLFLDEIGDMPLAMQVKLLRTIQERQVRHLGGERDIPVEFRLIAATHQDLKEKVRVGAFREDLYYRIHVIQVRLPPLRERREDILWLARRFLAETAGSSDRPRLLSPAAEQALMANDWPGNVRELKHAMERAQVLAQGPVIQAELFGTERVRASGDSPSAPLSDWIATQERDYILRALESQDWRVQDTAALLGISRKNLWEKMKRLDVRRMTVDPTDPE